MRKFRIIGRLLDAHLDADGNLHITLRNNDSFWTKIAVRYLRLLKNRVLVFEVEKWRSRRAERSPLGARGAFSFLLLGDPFSSRGAAPNALRRKVGKNREAPRSTASRD